MHTHDDLTQLALDELYGLLDGPKAQAARERLATPAGREARRDAEKLRSLLTAAAKLQFPEARFTPPVMHSTASRAGSVRWVGWVVAASALFAISIPGISEVLAERTRVARAERAQAAAEGAQAEFARAFTSWQENVKSAVDERAGAVAELLNKRSEFIGAIDKARADVQAGKLNVVVNGPAAFTPGEPNYYGISAQDANGQPAEVKLVARVVDPAGRSVYDVPTFTTAGTFQLKLPGDLPLTPDRDLSLEILTANTPKPELKHKIPLAAPVYLAHLTTDKPMYQPGETVHFRALVLERGNLQPPTDQLKLTLSVLDPQGAELSNLNGISKLAGDKDNRLRGLAAGEYTLGESAAGGEYTVRLREESNRTREQNRKFIVNKYQPALLEKKLEFTRKSYGPGDEVMAACKATRINGPLAHQPVQAAAQVDGVELQVDHAKSTDGQGNVLVKFRLPAQIEKGAASVRVTFTDGGAVEALVKPVPVVVKKLNIEFYPEGGELIAGVPNRVYVQVRTPLGKPADLKGRIVDADGKNVADFETLNDDREPGINQGQGRFAFTPKDGVKYRLAIDKPEGITSEHVLPAAKATGVVLNTGVGVATDRDALPLSITVAGPERTLYVAAYARGRLLDSKRLTAAPGKAIDVTLNPPVGYGGITRVTAFEQKGDGPTTQLVPVAERLVFRSPSKKLTVTAAADKTAYAPGDKAGLKVSAKDEAGKDVPAIALVGVVNQSVVVMADEKNFRTMPTHFFLTDEVEKADDLEHIDVVLGAHPKAAQALDLLLGVQGWRRFVETGELPKPSAGGGGGSAGRVGNLQRARVPVAPKYRSDTYDYAMTTAAQEKRPARELARGQLEAATNKLTAVVDTPADLVAKQQQLQQTQKAAQELTLARDQAKEARTEQLQRVLPWATLLPGLIGLVAFGLTLARGSRHFLGSIACIVVAVFAGYGWMNVPRHEAASVELAQERDEPQKSEPKDAPVATPAAIDATQLFATLHNLNLQPHIGYFPHQQPEELAKAILNLQIDKSGDVKYKWGDTVAFTGVTTGGVEAKHDERGFGSGANAAGARPGADRQDNPKHLDALRVRQKLDESRAGSKAAATPPPVAPGGVAERRAAAPAVTKSTIADPRSGGIPRGGIAPPQNRPMPALMPAQKPVAEKEELAQRAQEELARRKLPMYGDDRVGKRVKELRESEQDLARKLGDKHPNVVATREAIKAMEAWTKGETELKLLREVDADKGVLLNPTALREPAFKRYAELGGRALFDAEPRPEPFVVREYAHVHKPTTDGVRDDFTETVFWHPALIVPGEGVTARFDLSDAVTRYQALVAVHTLDGRLGAAQAELTARKPISLEPKLPVEITAGDRIDVPVTISNETDQPRDVKLSLESPGLIPVGPQTTMNWSQGANSRTRKLFGFRPLHVEGVARVRLKAAGEDAIERVVPIVPSGFPVQGQFSNELRGSAKHIVTLPSTWVNGTLKCEVALFPTPLADLQRGLDGLLREPGGCFEQTSTTNYPNTLIMDYLRETNQASPEIMARAKGMLDRGYARLTSFEVPAGQKKEGYEWFGHAPAHEALTAYGLLQFRDMARVADVDPAMLQRTSQYLLSRRDGQGGFQRSKAALDSFGRASEQGTNAYIVWAITESGKADDVTKELNRLEREALTNQDPYFLALVANALWNRDRREPARAVLTRLVTLQERDGGFPAVTKSITGSHGKPLQIETTALALLGWLKANQPGEYGVSVRNAVKWLGQQRQGTGSFGPTQSTIMALKALVAYAKAYKQPPESGTMTLRLGEQVLATADFTPDRQDAIVLTVPEAEKWLKAGDNELSLMTTGKNMYPYTVAWSYQTLQPPSAAGCAVKLTTSIVKNELNEGESTRLHVAVENISKQGQGMTTAIIGLPAGMSFPDDFKQLRDLARLVDGKPGTIAFWELRGRELILYWRDLAPDAKVEMNLDVIARIPGKYSGPASRAYLYYDPEMKCWTAPLNATIKAAE